MTRDRKIRVVIADDHVVVRDGLRAVLAASKDIEVVGEAGDGREAVAVVERLLPDVVLMDLSMEPVDGAEATRQIVARRLPTRVLVLTMHGADSHLIPLLEGGAAGFLSKTADARDLVAAVHAVARGDVYLLPAAARAVAARYSGEHARHAIPSPST